MSAFHKPIVILGASLSWVLVGFGCGSGGSDSDDDGGSGSVLGGTAGATTGGSSTTGGAGGKGGTGGKGGSGTGGATGGSGGSGGSVGNCTAVGETFDVVDSMPSGACCAGLTPNCDLTTTTDPETGIMRSNGICTCEDGAAAGGTGGAAGSGGATGGTGGTGGSSAGAGGSSGATGSGALGASCASDGDCASGLTCVTETSGALDVGSPAGGLCTLACTADAECTALAAGAYCVAFDEAQTITYCLEGCTTGMAGEPKCNGRTDVACGLLGLLLGTTACTTSDDCAMTELCATGEAMPVCGEIVTGCVPNCGGDFDCAAGDFCDFSTGLCVPNAPPGDPIGTPCDPDATTNPCNGFCSATDETATEGVCSAFCTMDPGLLGCGWDGMAVPDAACLFLTRLSPDLGRGDLGLCGALCDCNDDCEASTQRCVDETGGEIMTIFGRAGYCRVLQTGETEADTIACP